jgi:membrane protease YdiL (CAAX protease family)
MRAFLTVISLLLAVLALGVLRALPTVPGLPTVWSHPLGLVVLLLFVVWVSARADGRSFPALPVLTALAAEGWIRLAFFNPTFEAWLAPHLMERVADSTYHLLGAVWIFGVAALFGVAARADLKGSLTTATWKSGLYLHTLSVLFVYGLLSVLLQTVEGFRGLSLRVPIYTTGAFWVVVGQTALCFGEEIFYRGFLTRALAAAVARGGPVSPAHLGAGIALSSILFAFDHVRSMPWGAALLMTGLYTLFLGLLLGYVVRLSGNLILATLAHLFHNLMILRLGLSVSDLGGFIGFEAMTYISIYFILTFSILFLMRRPAWAPLRRAIAGAA